MYTTGQKSLLCLSPWVSHVVDVRYGWVKSSLWWNSGTPGNDPPLHSFKDLPIFDNYTLFFHFVVLFRDKISLCRPGWSWIQGDLSASASGVLTLKACITTTALFYFFYFIFVFIKASFLSIAHPVLDQADSRLSHLPASASWVQGVKVYTTSLVVIDFFF